MRVRTLVVASFMCALLAACGSGPRTAGAVAEGTISVTGDVERQLALDENSIRRDFAAVLQVLVHRTGSGAVELLGLPLFHLVTAAGPVLDQGTKHPEAAVAVLIEARDGYSVAFAFEELQPDREGRHSVFLAIADKDGPLPKRFAPARLVLDPGGGNSRRIAGIERIEVIDLRRLAARRRRTEP